MKAYGLLALLLVSGCGENPAIQVLKKTEHYEHIKNCTGFDGRIQLFMNGSKCGEHCIVLVIDKKVNDRKISLKREYGVNVGSEYVVPAKEFYLVEEIEIVNDKGRRGIVENYVTNISYSDYCQGKWD